MPVGMLSVWTTLKPKQLKPTVSYSSRRSRRWALCSAVSIASSCATRSWPKLALSVVRTQSKLSVNSLPAKIEGRSDRSMGTRTDFSLENSSAALTQLGEGKPALVWRKTIADTETPVGAGSSVSSASPKACAAGSPIRVVRAVYVGMSWLLGGCPFA